MARTNTAGSTQRSCRHMATGRPAKRTRELIVVSPSVERVGWSSDVLLFPGSDLSARGIENPFVVGLANLLAGFAGQLSPDRRPDVVDRVVGFRTGRCDRVGAEQKAVRIAVEDGDDV